MRNFIESDFAFYKKKQQQRELVYLVEKSHKTQDGPSFVSKSSNYEMLHTLVRKEGNWTVFYNRPYDFDTNLI